MGLDKESREGVRNTVQVCMDVHADDRVFIITDDETLMIGQGLADEASATGASVKLIRLEEYDKRPITNVPEELVRHLVEFEPTVIFRAYSSQEGERNMRMGVRNQVMEQFALREMVPPRGVDMLGVTPRLLREGMRANYDQIHKLTMHIYDIVHQAETIHVISNKGSDVLARFDPDLKWVPCYGLYHEPGTGGNLPDGEVFTCPATVEGTVIADVLGDYFSPKYGVLAHPMTFEIVGGLVKKVFCEDKDLEAEVWTYLNSSENALRVGEFAIGTNTAVKELSGNMLQDEKMPGIHVAFGDPWGFVTGAPWSSDVHMDVVPTRCTIEVDGKVIMEDSEFQLSRYTV